MARLRDAQLASLDKLKEHDKVLNRLNDPSHSSYIKFGPLGKALQRQLPTVVLIDEIDKADIDFPNDLLLELDEKRFFIEETEGTRIPQHNLFFPKPIVIITSNQEKDLPDAFLRRCLFHYIEPHNSEELTKIIKANFGTQLSDELIDKIVNIFLEIQKETNKGTGKVVSTSELIDWIKALLLDCTDLEKII